MTSEIDNFVQFNSPDGGFLQSDEWRKFQESVGRKTYNITSENFWANIIEHSLPLVGKYFYVPRGPIVQIKNNKLQITNKSQNSNDQILKQIQELINLAKKENAGWIRIEPATEKVLEIISKAELFQNKSSALNIKKSPHDMQPKEIFVVDISKTGEQLLAEMKPKTRYNIRLAEKKGVKIFNFQFSIFNQFSNSNDQNPKEAISYKLKAKSYIEEFLRLVKITAKRDDITPHPENYYRKMLEIIPGDILKLYVAEYESKIIAANLVVFYGNTATYLHGASDNEHRNVMAPYLLQWRQIQDAKVAGYARYDFGGIATSYPPAGEAGKLQATSYNPWAGITRFKLGFSPDTKPTVFPGSYDIIIDRKKYYLYWVIQKIKWIVK